MVSPLGVPTSCNLNQLACPTGPKAPSTHKGQFPKLSNLHGARRGARTQFSTGPPKQKPAGESPPGGLSKHCSAISQNKV
jgi:hypothetical protein